MSASSYEVAFSGCGLAKALQAWQVFTIGMHISCMCLGTPARSSSCIIAFAGQCHHLKWSFRSVTLAAAGVAMRSTRSTRLTSKVLQSSGSTFFSSTFGFCRTDCSGYVCMHLQHRLRRLPRVLGRRQRNEVERKSTSVRRRRRPWAAYGHLQPNKAKHGQLG